MTSRANPGPLAFFATPPHACSYLPERKAVTVFADPAFQHDQRVYTALSRYGFRRSGSQVYRPHCPDCEACVPVRVPVREFRPRRNQRRAWQANRHLQIHRLPAGFSQEHYDLYARYVKARHAGGGMDSPTPAQYLEFLTSLWSETIFYEFRGPEGLLAVAVVDQLEDGLSAVYTFFEPALRGRSLGIYAVLWEIEAARRLGLEWLYLGYWIRESSKMRYKDQYQPLEYLHHGAWRRTPPP
jgi:leucyl-tRNA---protein transferase